MKNEVILKEYFNTKLHYQELLRKADDRRYAEVSIEKEKALKIKDEADKVALGLARDIQKYKDEKANELREQINRERNLYVSNDKLESTVKPLLDYMNAQAGKSAGYSSVWTYLTGGIALILALMWIFILLSGHLK